MIVLCDFTGKDVIGLAQTGSGKTGAFALPILHALLEAPRPKDFFACVLSPTRLIPNLGFDSLLFIFNNVKLYYLAYNYFYFHAGFFSLDLGSLLFKSLSSLKL